MSGLALLIEHGGATLELADADVLVLRQPDGRASRVGLHALDSVVIDADVLVASAALRAMAAHGVGLVVAPSGRKSAVGWCQCGPRGVQLRHRQHLAYAQPTRRLALARVVVQAKLEGQIATLQALGLGVPALLREAALGIGSAASVAALRGKEGAQAHAYFSTFARLWEPAWHYDGTRSRRPPQDAVNALLSLGYTLARGVCCRELAADGFDLALGFLHEMAPPRAVLADDALEGCRGLVDRWVRRLADEREAKPGDFEYTADDGCRLKPNARRAVYAHWFATMVPPLQARVRQLARALHQALGDAAVDSADLPNRSNHVTNHEGEPR